MSQTELFCLLLVTGMMAIAGVREASYGRYAIAATLLMIPLAGWASLLIGRPS